MIFIKPSSSDFFRKTPFLFDHTYLELYSLAIFDSQNNLRFSFDKSRFIYIIYLYKSEHLKMTYVFN